SLALDFYRDTLDDDCTVGEALRRTRCNWTPTTSTRLAYVYWGHPDLRLHLAPGARTDAPPSADPVAVTPTDDPPATPELQEDSHG
ncbi:MAG TPA: hypothetical protein VJ978_01945, partial [Nitriliruptoraceae bacterium]|nr:hypothetical protein [Nitriliruptoraceae bacterium]